MTTIAPFYGAQLHVRLVRYFPAPATTVLG